MTVKRSRRKAPNISKKSKGKKTGRTTTVRPAEGRAPSRGRPVGRVREPESLRLTELLHEDVVKLRLDAAGQWDAVDELVRLLVAAGELPAELGPEAVRAVGEREAIRPTGWKCGLAFPNGRVPGLRRVVAALGISPKGIDFSCRDGLPARIVVLLLFPPACHARFAPSIRDLAESFEDAALRKALLAARKAAGVVAAIEEAETYEIG